jgi:hypothetical protein
MSHTIPKLCGADVELGNFVEGVERPDGTGAEASRVLIRTLARIARGVGRIPERARTMRDPQDWARVHLPANGGCAYVDLDHLELCLPEVRGAHDHVAAWHAMLRLAQAALTAANAAQPDGRRIRALVNNSDGHGNSYGGHLNVLVTRAAWNNLMERKLHYLAWLAAFQASSVVFTGQGKVGSEHGTPPARYQLSQRADFIETMLGPQTTYRRPLVNTRDEPLCGGGPWSSLLDPAHPGRRLARLHVICFDSTLCQVASLLRVGTMQMMLALVEANRVDPTLALEDPLRTLRAWSRDPLLRATAPLVDGRRVTAVELQRRFLEAARHAHQDHVFDGVVPRADEILALWEDTLDRLDHQDWTAAARRLDWVLKLAMLERALAQRPDLSWEAPALKVLDHLYASLDPSEGLYWAWAAAGLVEPVVPEEAIARLEVEPPEDTRAWGRAMALRRALPDAVDQVDWDAIRFRLDPAAAGTRYWRLSLPDPLGATRHDLESVFANAATLPALLPALGAEPETGRPGIRRRNVRLVSGIRTTKLLREGS